MTIQYKTLEDFVGNTPLIQLQRLPYRLISDLKERNNKILVKLEGNNPAGSVKDRPALSMIKLAEQRGQIKIGDTLIEPTSGNTGIALAMIASIRGYKMILVMPESMSLERRQTMSVYGAEIVLTPAELSMEGAIDKARELEKQGVGKILNQFGNVDNPEAHYLTTGPEIWNDTQGTITHFVSAMGTTGTIMGTSRYLKEQNPSVQIVGVQPIDGVQIPGIRKWPIEYLPAIFDRNRIDQIIEVTDVDSVELVRNLAKEEGIFTGPSSGGALLASLEIAKSVENATIVSIICDRGDRYLSTGIFN